MPANGGRKTVPPTLWQCKIVNMLMAPATDAESPDSAVGRSKLDVLQRGWPNLEKYVILLGFFVPILYTKNRVYVNSYVL